MSPPPSLARLATGGTAVVDLAVAGVPRRLVVLKVAFRQQADRPEVRRRFAAEASLHSSLSHPAFPALLDCDPQARIPWLALEYRRGTRLDHRLAGASLPLLEALDLVLELASSLSALHAAGRVHGDLKPANLLLGDDASLTVLDLGAARVPDQATSPDEGPPTLTPGYAAPEQLLGEPPGIRSDLYAAGLVAFEILTGCPALASGDLRGLVHEAAADRIPHLAELAPEVPGEIADMIHSATRRDPGSRPASPGAFGEPFQNVRDGLEARLGARGELRARLREWRAGRLPMAPAELPEGPAARLLLARSAFRRGATEEAHRQLAAAVGAGHDARLAALEACEMRLSAGILEGSGSGVPTFPRKPPDHVPGPFDRRLAAEHKALLAWAGSR